MWHSVVRRPIDYLNQDIRCSVAYLDAVLRTCRKHGISVVDMDEALERLIQPAAGRFVVMTFDDGYRDNVTAALPIFERYNLPLVVYPAVGLITRQAFYWWGGLVELLKRSDSVDIEGLGRFETRSLIEKRRSLAAINRWVEGDVTQRCEALRGTFETQRIDLPDLMARDTMSAEELKSLARHPLVSIGSHTFSHTYLRPLTDAIASDEIAGSKKWLEDLTQQPVDHFSYPHGDARACGTREATMVQRAGYRTAVSTRRGKSFPGSRECTVPPTPGRRKSAPRDCGEPDVPAFGHPAIPGFSGWPTGGSGYHSSRELEVLVSQREHVRHAPVMALCDEHCRLKLLRVARGAQYRRRSAMLDQAWVGRPSD